MPTSASCGEGARWGRPATRRRGKGYGTTIQHEALILYAKASETGLRISPTHTQSPRGTRCWFQLYGRRALPPLFLAHPLTFTHTARLIRTSDTSGQPRPIVKQRVREIYRRRRDQSLYPQYGYIYDDAQVLQAALNEVAARPELSEGASMPKERVRCPKQGCDGFVDADIKYEYDSGGVQIGYTISGYSAVVATTPTAPGAAEKPSPGSSTQGGTCGC
jgi:hypothetical protein